MDHQRSTTSVFHLEEMKLDLWSSYLASFIGTLTYRALCCWWLRWWAARTETSLQAGPFPPHMHRLWGPTLRGGRGWSEVSLFLRQQKGLQRWQTPVVSQKGGNCVFKLFLVAPNNKWRPPANLSLSTKQNGSKEKQLGSIPKKEQSQFSAKQSRKTSCMQTTVRASDSCRAH